MTDYHARVHARLNELAALKPGWLDGEGPALSPTVLATAAVVAESTAQWAGNTSVYPTPDGGVQIEWSDPHANHSITISPDLRMRLDTTEKHGADEVPHVYLSTGCFHGEHHYCQSNTGAAGTKVPAQCKFCAAPCVCDCHITD